VDAVFLATRFAVSGKSKSLFRLGSGRALYRAEAKDGVTRG